MTRVTRFALVAVGVVTLVVIAVVGAVLLRSDDEKSAGPKPAPSSPTRSSKSSSACGLKDGPTAGLQKAPAAEWKFVGKLAAPFSRTAGPAKTTEGAHHCFARSTEGAVFAAAFTAIDGSAGADPVKAIELHYLPTSPGYAAALDEARAQSGRPSSSGLQIAGFRVDSSLRDSATVTLALRSSGGANAGGLVAFTLTLKWDDASGDWRTVMPPDGPQANALGSLDGFVEWSGT